MMSNRKLYFLFSLFIISLCFGLYLSFNSPADYKQGEIVRIMYVHVPSAWMSLGIFGVIFGCGLTNLIWNYGANLARAIAPCGAGFTLICLVTGSIWGKYTWGAWWVWDARLTSMLFMMLIYIAYIMLWNLFPDNTRASVVTSLFAIFGAINIPIVKFSVDMWATLHQGSSFFRKGGVAIDPSMRFPLLAMVVTFLLFAILFTILRVRTIAINEEFRVSLSSMSKR